MSKETIRVLVGPPGFTIPWKRIFFGPRNDLTQRNNSCSQTEYRKATLKACVHLAAVLSSTAVVARGRCADHRDRIPWIPESIRDFHEPSPTLRSPSSGPRDNLRNRSGTGLGVAIGALVLIVRAIVTSGWAILI